VPRTGESAAARPRRPEADRVSGDTGACPRCRSLQPALDLFNHAVSFVVNCDNQAELDRYWNALLEGGSAEQCGWLKDRFGLSWQIVPTVLGKMMAAPDRARAKRASDVMMKMVRIDIAALEAAFAA
jgi:predicted 3-demethylubiquinone-9 3-methyltransferase (glyoxalase superfamily)